MGWGGGGGPLWMSQAGDTFHDIHSRFCYVIDISDAW